MFPSRRCFPLFSSKPDYRFNNSCKLLQKGARGLQGRSASSLQDPHSDSDGSNWAFSHRHTEEAMNWATDPLVQPHLLQNGPQSFGFEEFELLLGKDSDCFDPDDSDQNMDNYFREVGHIVTDLFHESRRGNVKLVRKTSVKAEHKFIQTQTPTVRMIIMSFVMHCWRKYSLPLMRPTPN